MANYNIKPGPGRSSGSKNRLSIERDELLAKLDAMYPGEENDPIINMVMIAKDRSSSPELKGKMWGDVASFTYAKKKAIEHSGEINQDLTATEKVSKLSPTQFKALLDMELDNTPTDGEDDVS